MNKLLLEYLNKILYEYTDEEKQKMGIPLDAESRGGRWYRGDIYVGRVEGGKFIRAGDEVPVGEPQSVRDTSKEKRTGTTDERPSSDTITAPLRKATSSEETAARSIYPDAKEVSVVAEIDHVEVESMMGELGISSGETDLSPDMDTLSEDYLDQMLTGDYGDDEYYSRMKTAGHRIRSPRYEIPSAIRESLLSNGFPTHYIQLLERSINTERLGDNPPFTEMLSGVGAGQNQSQFGEIASMAMICLFPEQREEFANALANTIGTPAVQKNNNLISPIADISWIRAAVGHAESFDTMMDEQYGEGMWRLEAAAWDRRSDIEAIGLPYSNKGFSTDVVLRVQPLDDDYNPTGPAQAQRVSLKKDEKVMLFNGGVGEVDNLMMQGYLTDKQYAVHRILSRIDVLLRSKVKQQRELGLRLASRLLGQEFSDTNSASGAVSDIKTKLENLARQNAPEEVVSVRDRVASFSQDQKDSGVGLMVSIALDDSLDNLSDSEIDKLIDESTDASGAKSFKSSSHKTQAKKFWKVLQKCKQEIKATSSLSNENIEACVTEKLGSKSLEILAKMGTFVGKIAAAANPKLHQENIDTHLNLAVKLGDDYMRVFHPENREMLGGLIGVLAEKFPLKVVMDNTEKMIINGVHISGETLKTMLGVDSYEEIQLGLKILSVDGVPMLVYQAKGSDEPVIIGTVDTRQKGRGYSSVGFEIKCSDEFVLSAARANEKNGHTSRSNTTAIERLSGRKKKRDTKK